MAFYNDNYVVTGNARVLWDGITRPEALDDGGKKFTLKVAMPSAAVETGELRAIIDRELKQGVFQGVLPAGANQAMSDVKPGEYGDMLPGHIVFNTTTYSTPPDVYDINGQKLDPMAYGQMFYPGATVQLIVSARSYNNKSKGMGFWLNGIKIIDATSPKLPVGSGQIDAAAAFGAAPAAAPATPPTTPAASSAPAPMPAPAAPSAAPAPGPAVQPAHDFLTVNGAQYTEQQLRDAGWSEAQIAAARG